MNDLKWAAKTMLTLAGIPASPKYIAAFENNAANHQWVLSVIRQASPKVGGMYNVQYTQAIEILQANGIQTNSFTAGNGTAPQ